MASFPSQGNSKPDKNDSRQRQVKEDDSEEPEFRPTTTFQNSTGRRAFMLQPLRENEALGEEVDVDGLDSEVDSELEDDVFDDTEPLSATDDQLEAGHMSSDEDDDSTSNYRSSDEHIGDEWSIYGHEFQREVSQGMEEVEFEFDEDVLPHGCYSPSCTCGRHWDDGNCGTNSWPYCRCYCASCRAQHRQSWWKHPCLKRLLVRCKIVCALRSRESVRPFSSFVPRVLHDHIIKRSMRTSDTDVPDGAVRQGAVAFADASGFTRLTESLSHEPDGAEKLCAILNKYYTKLVEIVNQFGGDIVKFAGDALSIVWFAGGPKDPCETVAEASLLAAQCSYQIHQEMDNYLAYEDPRTGKVHKLRQHIGIGCGEITCIHVGGVFGRWEFVITGPPMAQIAHAEPLAQPGETVVSPEVWEHIGSVAQGTTVRQLHDNSKVKRKAAAPTHENENYMALLGINTSIPEVTLPKSELRSKHIPVLQRYIPAAVQPSLGAGHDAYLAEIRDVTVLFAKFSGISLAAEDGNCATAIEAGQSLMLTVQEVVYTWEGSINKFLVDDKGILCLCVFGLPPVSHADDPKRAAGAAKMLVEMTQKLGMSVSCAVGVATGETFCGVVGSNDRREYTVMGRIVNLSARLMTAAGANQVLVDEATMLASKHVIIYEEKTSLELKGFKHSVRNFVPHAVKQAESKKKSTMQLESRKDEMECMENMLRSVVGGATMILTGERGSGKGVLTEQLEKLGTQAGFEVFKGDNTKARKQSDAPSPTTSKAPAQAAVSPFADVDLKAIFQPWQEIIQGIIERGSAKAQVTREEWILRVLPKELIMQSKLLDHLIPDLHLSDLPLRKFAGPIPKQPRRSRTNSVSAATRLAAMASAGQTTSQRMDTLLRIMARLIDSYSEDEPTMLLLHLQTGTSAQPVDLESWRLAHMVSRMCEERHERAGNLRPVTAPAPATSKPSEEDMALQLESSTDANDSCVKGGSRAWSLRDAKWHTIDGSTLTVLAEDEDEQDAAADSVDQPRTGSFGRRRRSSPMSPAKRPVTSPHQMRRGLSFLGETSAADDGSDRSSSRKAKLVLSVVSRPLVNHAPFEFLEIVEAARSQGMLLQLKPLSEEQREQYLRLALKVADLYPLPKELVKFFSDMAAGNPKHIEELAAAMLEQKALEVKDGRAVLLTDDFSQVNIPPKMAGAIKLMLDHMTVRHQLIVKVASTCDFFSKQMLAEILPYDEDVQQLDSALAELVDSGIFSEVYPPNIPSDVLACDPNTPVCYRFSSQLMRETANRRLLAANRKELEESRLKVTVLGSVRSVFRTQGKTHAWLRTAERGGSTSSRGPSSSPGRRNAGPGSTSGGGCAAGHGGRRKGLNRSRETSSSNVLANAALSATSSPSRRASQHRSSQGSVASGAISFQNFGRASSASPLPAGSAPQRRRLSRAHVANSRQDPAYLSPHRLHSLEEEEGHGSTDAPLSSSHDTHRRARGSDGVQEALVARSHFDRESGVFVRKMSRSWHGKGKRSSSKRK